MTRLETRPSAAKLLLVPAVIVALTAGVFGYLHATTPPGRFAPLIEGNLLSLDAVRTALTQHVFLVAVSFGIVVVIGLPLGVVVQRVGGIPCDLALAIAGLGQAVPSVAVLLFLEVLLGLGSGPAIIALVVFALLPLLRNTVVGLNGVDPAAVDAARGAGMTSLQSLLRVELPLASGVVMAGLRTTLVLIVGTATLGNYVGAGGLGNIIAEGFGAPSGLVARIVLAGAVLAASLALLCDWLLSIVARAVIPRT